MASSSKKKHTFLTVETKLKILERLGKGESEVSLANIYGVGTSTVSDIKSKRVQLEQFVSKLDCEKGTLKRKIAHPANNKALEDAIYMHGIRELDVEGEKLSSDLATGSVFKEKFIRKHLKKEALPRKSPASRREKSTPRFKVSKERITAIVCANASGEHKVKLLVIGQSKKPRCFKNVQTLPVSYTSQTSAWTTSVIFLDWFKNEFIASVTKFHEEMKKSGEMQFLSPNVTATLQPMDQGVIKKMRICRKQLLRHLLLAEKGEESVVQFIKKFNIKDSI
ncbi:hypothetical protein PR048_032342 [Dryococelus australis]|uniref:HTH psq-type domain-containing protein n=1 Tax=Dryococelus australis TaxID=614101 RepID=A0ABQ9G1Y2_9NEOP|nr:hypothetical protein PR048_032342 [Dryococelus australis]